MFNGQVNARLDMIQDVWLRDSLRDGAAYAFAAGRSGLSSIMDPSSQMQVTQVYAKALRVVWLVVMAVGLLSFVLVPVEKSIKLKKKTDTEFGMKEKKKTRTDPVV